MLEQAKKAAEKELEDAKKAYKIAYDAGDSEAIVTAQENITAAKIKSDRLDNFKLQSAYSFEPSTKPKSLHSFLALLTAFAKDSFNR